MHDTQLIHAIANDSHLRTRIDAIIRRRSTAVTTVERLMLATAPIDAIAWDAACDPDILATVRDALNDNDPQVTQAVATVSDDDLDTLVVQQLTFLQQD